MSAPAQPPRRARPSGARWQGYCPMRGRQMQMSVSNAYRQGMTPDETALLGIETSFSFSIQADGQVRNASGDTVAWRDGDSWVLKYNGKRYTDIDFEES